MLKNKKKTVIIVCGPTAIGKTAVAISLAKSLKTEIINADSRQIYKELNIGVAKPSPNELAQVKHHLIGTQSINELYGAGDFEKEALKITNEIFEKKDSLIMCGGTGLYLKAFCEGLDNLPKADEDYRNELHEKFKTRSLTYLQDELLKFDPEAKNLIDFNNPQRLMRVLEVIKVSGEKYSSVLQGKKANRPFEIIKIGLNTNRVDLYERINKRVDEMIEKGLIDEVRGLKNYQGLNALKTVGYSEIFDFLDDKCSLKDAIDKIKQHTRNYAKRQLTWFRADNEITWFEPNEGDKIFSFVQSKLN